jgi:hypothetical protein
MIVDDLFENAGSGLQIGDPVIITGNVEFRGKTGDVKDFNRDGSFVVVDLYNYGPQSFHVSDVSRNDYADEEDELAEAPTDTPQFQRMMSNIQQSTPNAVDGYVMVSFASEQGSKRIRGATLNNQPLDTVDSDELARGQIKFQPDQIEQRLRAIGGRYGWDSIDVGQGQGHTEMFFETNKEYTTRNQNVLAARIVKTVTEINQFFAGMNQSLQATGVPGYQVDVAQEIEIGDKQITDLRQIASMAQSRRQQTPAGDPGKQIGQVILANYKRFDQTGYSAQDLAQAAQVARVYITQGERAGLQAQIKSDVSDMIDELLSDADASRLRTVWELDESGVAEGELATYMVRVMDSATGEHWRIEVKVTSPEMAKERAEAMGYKVLGVEEKGVAEGGVLKSIKRGLKGWSGDADLAITGKRNKPKDVVQRTKGYDTDTLKSLSKNSAPAKGSPAALQQKVISRELKKRGEPGVAESYDLGAFPGIKFLNPTTGKMGSFYYWSSVEGKNEALSMITNKKLVAAHDDGTPMTWDEYKQALDAGQQGVAEGSSDDPQFQRMLSNIQQSTPQVDRSSKVLKLIERYRPEWFDQYGLGEVEDTVVDMFDMGRFEGMTTSDAVKAVGQALESMYGRDDVAEDIKQIDELSPEKLSDYKKKATKDSWRKIMQGDFKKGDKRLSSVVKATDRLTKDELEKGVAESKYPWLDAEKPPKQPNAPRLVRDRKTGKEYDPHLAFAKTMNSPEVRAQMKRMAQKEGVVAGLNEFAPPGGGGDDGDLPEILRQLAAQWWNGDEDPRAERTLAAMGWEIGQDDGYDNGGVFVVRAGDEHGKSYTSWPAEDLEGLSESYNNSLEEIDRRGFLKGLGAAALAGAGAGAAQAGSSPNTKSDAAREEFYRVRDMADRFSTANAQFRQEYQPIADFRNRNAHSIMTSSRKSSPDPKLAARQHQELVKMIRDLDAEFVEKVTALLKKYRALQEQDIDEGWKQNLAALGVAGALGLGSVGGAQASTDPASDKIVATLVIDGEQRTLDLTAKNDVRAAEQFVRDVMKRQGIENYQYIIKGKGQTARCVGGPCGLEFGNTREGVEEANDEKIAGQYDPEEFDQMVLRLKTLAGAGPLKTVWDPAKRVYKNVPINPPQSQK